MYNTDNWENIMNVDIITGKNSVHKLTVTVSGDVRIKIAKGSSKEEHNRIVESFTKVATEAVTVAESTLRGKIHLDDDHPTIKLYNDSKNKHFTFDL